MDQPDIVHSGQQLEPIIALITKHKRCQLLPGEDVLYHYCDDKLVALPFAGFGMGLLTDESEDCILLTNLRVIKISPKKPVVYIKRSQISAITHQKNGVTEYVWKCDVLCVMCYV